MFSLQSTDELVFGSSNYSIASQSDDGIIKDLVQDHAFIQTNVIDFTAAGYKQPRLTEPTRRPIKTSRDVCGQRRDLHRDIERKRRQEMSDLYSSLRSLLPDEMVKGKPSICDHMHEAENYIKKLKRGIQELEIHRDKLKKKVSETSDNGGNNSPNLVTVNLVGNWVEVLISCSTDSGLSRVVGELIEKEVNVVTCVSTKTKARFLHKILAEVNDDDLHTLDPMALKQKLSQIIDPSSYSYQDF